MDNYSYISNANPDYIEDLYKQYKQDPNSVDTGWKQFFEGYDFSQENPIETSSIDQKEINVYKLIHGYRARGHLISNTNPIRERRIHAADLELGYFGLSEADLDTEFNAGKDIKIGRATLRVILAHLHQTYCSCIGVEFTYCRNEKLRQWLYDNMEPNGNTPQFSNDEKHHILKKINQGVTFENFLQTKYVGKKRFSLEGLEALIPSLDSTIREGANLGVRSFVLGMAHRGRLNVLVNIFEKSYEDVFSEFEETSFDDKALFAGDVKYHLGKSADIVTEKGQKIHLSLVPNASHLEAIGPVVEGVVRAKQIETFKGDKTKVVPIVLHGDSAISGQGVNYEMSNMSKLEGYDNGGTIHIVLNNQVGFTANYKESRSTVYCTDLAKVTESPVFHVSADHPEAVVHVMQMAVRIRQEFGIDVYVDILGYRKYGHNEGDEPRFTQPLLYKKISSHNNVYQLYLERLVKNQDITQKEADTYMDAFKTTLQKKLDYAKKEKQNVDVDTLKSHWSDYRFATDKDFEKSINTPATKKDLDQVAKALVSEPKDINLFSKMKKLLKHRNKLYFEEKKVDWAMAELLAYGSLLSDGHAVRLSGQDSQRGTFSHRHSVIKDAENESIYVPLNNIKKDQAKFDVYNSFLSEYACMAFEYGYSLASPNSLVIWEAQFGDFANGAQIVIDQFISSCETKWQRLSGLVLLLPHGYEGQGPEHSSARLERFLQMCAENNMYVVNATTPANFFHLLRRQVKNKFRKPLVVMSPKSLLRHPLVTSNVSELSTGSFQEVIDDSVVDPKKVKRVYLCSGKIYYDCLEKRETEGRKDFAIVRLEQLYPFPRKQLDVLKKKYKDAEWTFIQEEPQNMGPWMHIVRFLSDWKISVIARADSASPATGSAVFHARTQQKLLTEMINF
jgi:2-oxoglutarate dehydrogenase E1 component